MPQGTRLHISAAALSSIPSSHQPLSHAFRKRSVKIRRRNSPSREGVCRTNSIPPDKYLNAAFSFFLLLLLVNIESWRDADSVLADSSRRGKLSSIVDSVIRVRISRVNGSDRGYLERVFEVFDFAYVLLGSGWCNY